MALYVVKTKISYGEETMIMPSTDPDTIFTELLQGLPIDIVEQAIEFKAFARSRKIKSATELLRVVLMFAGLDLTEREVAADLGRAPILHAVYRAYSAILERLYSDREECTRNGRAP